MKVYIVTEGKPNTGHEFSIRFATLRKDLALEIQKAFGYIGLEVLELDLFGTCEKF